MVVVLVIWEIVYLLGLKPDVTLPSPSAAWTELVSLIENGEAGADDLDEPVQGTFRVL